MDVQRLRDDDEDALRALLLTDPVANLFLLSYVEGYGVAVWPWLGVRRGGACQAR